MGNATSVPSVQKVWLGLSLTVLSVAGHPVMLTLGAGAIATLTLPLPAHAAVLTNWRFDPNSQQLEVTVPEGVTPRYFILAQPARIVLDLPNTNVGAVPEQQTYSGLVRQIRVGQFSPGLTRIVIELSPNATFASEQVELRQAEGASGTGGGDRWILRPLFANATPTPTTPRPAQPTPVPATPPPQEQNATPVTPPAANDPPMAEQTPTAVTTLPVLPPTPSAPVREPVMVTPPGSASVRDPVMVAPPSVTPSAPMPGPVTATPPPATPRPTPSPTAGVPDAPSEAPAIAPSTPLSPSPPPSTLPPLEPDATEIPVVPPVAPAPAPPPRPTPPPRSQPESQPEIRPEIRPETQSGSQSAPSAVAPATPPVSRSPQPPTTLPPASFPNDQPVTVRVPPLINSPGANRPGATTIPSPRPVAPPPAPSVAASPPPSPPSAPPPVAASPLPSSPPTPASALALPPAPTPSSNPVTAPPAAAPPPPPRSPASVQPTQQATAPIPPDVLVPSGTILSLRYPRDRILALQAGAPWQEVLVVNQPVRDRLGNVIVPEGSQVIGRFETNAAGSRFLAQAITLQGRNVRFNAASEALVGDRQISDERLVRNSTIGAVALTVLGAFTGVGLIAGAIAGAAAGAATTYVTAPQPAIIQPNQVVEVQLMEDLHRE